MSAWPRTIALRSQAVIRVALAVTVSLLAASSSCDSGGGFSSNPPASPSPAPVSCSPAPCLIDDGGMQLAVTAVARDVKPAHGTEKPGHHIVVVQVAWHYNGTGSESPLTGQVYLIGSDRVVVGQTTDSASPPFFPDCVDYDTPELASGGSFGPKPICFDLAVSPSGPLTLRWKHGLFGGSDQDLVLPG